ncbi:Rieske (2Fe-2S) protein [Candidatus Bathyarchaeota archaeon]|nr:MAG: Rieske (2Fe-2S) protein [Candidatus Bathyarchaeota archaeon]
MDDKKPGASTTTTPPPTFTPPPASTPDSAVPIKNPLISRRRFLQGAVAASVVLAAASVGASGQILGPLIPSSSTSEEIIDWTTLDNRYKDVKGKQGEFQPINYSEFFYYPYDSSVSPYYKNVIARLPDPIVNPNPAYSSDPILKHVVAFNVTCVHLRCLVNPGYAGNPGSGEFRLQCPCHGSQYRLTDGVPVAGPAYDLGLNPLPEVQLSVDANGKISAVGTLIGEPGIGRTL